MYESVGRMLVDRLGNEVRASEVAARLRDQGYERVSPQAVRRLIGQDIPAFSGRLWSVTPETLGALQRLAAAAPVGETSIAPALHREAECKPRDFPPNLPIAIRAALRAKPLRLSELVDHLARHGHNLSQKVVLACLRGTPQWFDLDLHRWALTEHAETSPLIRRQPTAPEAGPQDASLRRPTADEVKLPGLPTDPVELDTYLRIYRERRSVQAAADSAQRSRRYFDGASYPASASGRPGVWIAGCGEKYHFRRNCHLLVGGQAHARERGQGNSWVREVNLQQAHEMQRDACSACTPGTGSIGRR